MKFRRNWRTLISCKLSMQTHGEAAHLPPHFAYGKSGTRHFSKVNCTSIVGQYGVLKTSGVLCYAKGDTKRYTPACKEVELQ